MSWTIFVWLDSLFPQNLLYSLMVSIKLGDKILRPLIRCVDFTVTESTFALLYDIVLKLYIH